MKLADTNRAADSCDGPLATAQEQLTVRQAYALWAETYDSVANPLLSLEDRYLQLMLPLLADKTILDLGCGTGRLLDRLSLSATGWYLGIDLSSAMLEHAAKKLHVSGHLLQADCLKLPLRSNIADVVVSSFLLGYVDIQQLAAEIARVSKEDSDLYLSEFHPEGYSRGWKRSFRSGGRVIDLPTHHYSPLDVEDVFRLHGFDFVGIIEPGFGEPERQIFLANNKNDVFESSQGTRAIFISHLRRSSSAA